MFPGQLMVQQSPIASTLKDPADVLQNVYRLRPGDVALLRSARTAGEGSPAWKRAEQVVRSVFHAEIDRTYAQLNAHVQARFKKLGERIAATMQDVRADAQALGISLPDTTSLVPQVGTISRPADDQPFRTRAGKDQAMRVEIASVTSQVDMAVAPVQALHTVLVTSATTLDAGITKIKAALVPVEDRIRKLEVQINNADKQLTQLSLPFTWIAVEPRMFVLCYPTIFAALVMLSMLRAVRLASLRSRLRTRLEERGVSKEDVVLAMSVPDATIDHPGDPRSRAVLIPLGAVTVFLLGITWRVALSPAFGSRDVLLLNVPAILLIALTAYFATRRTA